MYQIPIKLLTLIKISLVIDIAIEAAVTALWMAISVAIQLRRLEASLHTIPTAPLTQHSSRQTK